MTAFEIRLAGLLRLDMVEELKPLGGQSVDRDGAGARGRYPIDTVRGPVDPFRDWHGDSR